MSAESIRRKFTRQLAGLEKYDRLTGWAIVSLYVGTILGSIVAGHYLIGFGLTPLTALIGFVLMMVIATRLRGLNNIVHECSHSTFTKDRNDNTRIGSFCASMTLGCFDVYKKEHLTHHAHLGDYEHDLDLKAIEEYGLHDPLNRKTILRHIMTPLTLRHLKTYLNWDLGRGDGLGFQLMKMGLLLLAVVFASLAPLTTVLFVLIPFALIYSALNYWADCLDHAGLVANEDEIDASRNVLAPPLVKLLFFPRNDCFHLVHHLFPHVPARHLENAHATLTDDPIYQQKQNAMPSTGVVGEIEVAR